MTFYSDHIFEIIYHTHALLEWIFIFWGMVHKECKVIAADASRMARTILLNITVNWVFEVKASVAYRYEIEISYTKNTMSQMQIPEWQQEKSFETSSLLELLRRRLMLLTYLKTRLLLHSNFLVSSRNT